VMVGLLRPLVDQDLAVVFYDMTTIRTDGLSEQAQDVRKFGMSKEGMVVRQVMLGVVQTAEGLPLYHEVFDGNTAEVSTLKDVIQRIVKQFPVKRVIAVADRGLLSPITWRIYKPSHCPAVACWSSFWRYQAGVTATSLIS
jgi:transposase